MGDKLQVILFTAYSAITTSYPFHCPSITELIISMANPATDERVSFIKFPISLLLIRAFSQSAVKSIWQEQATEPENNQKRYSAPDSWARRKYAVSTYISADRKAEIPSCRSRCEPRFVLPHACTQVQHLPLCGTRRTSDYLPAPPLLQRNHLQQATGAQKGMWRRYSKDLKNTRMYSSSGGLYCST